MLPKIKKNQLGNIIHNLGPLWKNFASELHMIPLTHSSQRSKSVGEEIGELKSKSEKQRVNHALLYMYAQYFGLDSTEIR